MGGWCLLPALLVHGRESKGTVLGLEENSSKESFLSAAPGGKMARVKEDSPHGTCVHCEIPIYLFPLACCLQEAEQQHCWCLFR